MQPTPRVERLRESFLSIKPSVSIDRARIEARVMRETEGESVVTRRAKVFAASAREMPIYIYPDQLIVGCIGGRPRCHNIVPGLDAAMRKASQTYILGLREDLPFDDLSDDEKVFHYGHNIHNHEKVVKKGFLGIKKDAEERLARIDLANAEDAAKVPFLEGVIMAMEAAAELGNRFAALAREQAEQEQDARRKAELLEIAEVCDWVPANPARTFREALQSYYISYLLLHWEVIPSMGFSQGRMDQYLGSYYENDIREGRITREEAKELIDCYLIGEN